MHSQIFDFIYCGCVCWQWLCLFKERTKDLFQFMWMWQSCSCRVCLFFTKYQILNIYKNIDQIVNVKSTVQYNCYHHPKDNHSMKSTRLENQGRCWPLPPSNKNLALKKPVFSTFSNFFKKKKKIYKSHFM